MMIDIGGGYLAEIDDADHRIVAPYNWYYALSDTTVYARTKIGGTTIALHRLILDAPDGLEVDHIDRNGLNNKRDNLRIATRGQNRANTDYSVGVAGYRGVSPIGNKWQAMITSEGIRHYLGLHDTPEDAARARDRKAKELLGEFADLNFPEEKAT